MLGTRKRADNAAEDPAWGDPDNNTEGDDDQDPDGRWSEPWQEVQSTSEGGQRECNDRTFATVWGRTKKTPRSEEAPVTNNSGELSPSPPQSPTGPGRKETHRSGRGPPDGDSRSQP